MVDCQDVINIIQHPVWRDEGCDCESVHGAEWTLHQRQDDQERKLHRAGSQTPENRYIPNISRITGKVSICKNKKEKLLFVKLPHQKCVGAANTEVRDFACVNQNMVNLECTWQKGAKTPANAQQHLYFWYVAVHLNPCDNWDSFNADGLSGLWFEIPPMEQFCCQRKEVGVRQPFRVMLNSTLIDLIRHDNLEKVEECPNYIMSKGFRSGCKFTGRSLPLFTDINICVNGSSPKGPLQAKFISLQIQNYSRNSFSPESSGKGIISVVLSACHCFCQYLSSQATENREAVRACSPRHNAHILGASCWWGAWILPGVGGGTPSSGTGRKKHNGSSLLWLSRTLSELSEAACLLLSFFIDSVPFVCI